MAIYDFTSNYDYAIGILERRVLLPKLNNKRESAIKALAIIIK
jgi:hypothetical protein